MSSFVLWTVLIYTFSSEQVTFDGFGDHIFSKWLFCEAVNVVLTHGSSWAVTLESERLACNPRSHQRAAKVKVRREILYISDVLKSSLRENTHICSVQISNTEIS